ncbi:hypothetical protein LO762_17165 [Actinocorallia sp. API 0066]|uniref:hypothetical protein n=1 Tax=Actinocorallia sp. API 0066 TaxID=2896846 RepID=UPI001E492A98|nr:hypothetical protein [Actinocorallia sp. API 0066]MCD0450911.1 hypothetical protein [Actinocorallia sp. API 0066]
MRRGEPEPSFRRGVAAVELLRRVRQKAGVTAEFGWAVSVDSVVVAGPGGTLLVWVSQPDDEPARYWADVPGGEVNDYLGAGEGADGLPQILGIIWRRVGCDG